MLECHNHISKKNNINFILILISLILFLLIIAFAFLIKKNLFWLYAKN